MRVQRKLKRLGWIVLTLAYVSLLAAIIAYNLPRELPQDETLERTIDPETLTF